MNIQALRLRPGQDLKAELERFTVDHALHAGFILTCVGSLTQASIRFANKEETTLLEGYFEIVSLVGTLCPDGSHLHIALSDGKGQMIGGHLQMGSRVYTTAEIVIGIAPRLTFSREFDAESGYPELVIRQEQS